MAITLPADGCALNFFGLGDPGPTHWRLWVLFSHNNEPKSHLHSPDAKEKSSFDIKRFNKSLHTDALVAICSPLRDLVTQQAVSFRIPNDYIRLLKHYHVKCLPEFAYQSLPDPELCYTFLRRWDQMGVRTLLHLLKTFYLIWIPLPRILPEYKMVQKTHKHRLTRRVIPCLFYL